MEYLETRKYLLLPHFSSLFYLTTLCKQSRCRRQVRFACCSQETPVTSPRDSATTKFAPSKSAVEFHRRHRRQVRGVCNRSGVIFQETQKRKSPMQRATYEYLRGNILDVFPEYKKDAEDHLSKAKRKSPMQRATYEYLRGNILDVFPEYKKDAEDHLSKAKRKSPMQRATYEYLRGNILDVFPEYKKDAEDHLSKAVFLRLRFVFIEPHPKQGGVHVIPVTSPELAREFLKKQDSTFASRPDCMSGRLSSNGYLTAVLSPMGDQWKKMRKVLSSCILSPAKHNLLHDKRMEEADNLIRYVYNQCKNSLEAGGLVNVRIAAQQYCGNVIRRLIFSKKYFGNGKEDGGPGPEEEEHVAALFTILTYLYGFSIADYIPWLEIFDFDDHKAILKKAIASLMKYHDPEIDGRIQMWKKGMISMEEDILDVLIQLQGLKRCSSFDH
ncbi:Uncharacterized protein Fot_41797 [Forsythia ovata]|uniref:Cytochrome P450 n=1 Tax=Forsythia ovata TaxID=205694 RepID=A0ABD1RJC2_9LAMI